MKKDKLLIILIAVALAILLTDIAYVTYLAITLHSVIVGADYLPLSFRPFTTAIVAINVALVPLAISYIFLRRR